MKITKKGVMPDGTNIQLEDWKEDYPGTYNTLTLAAYPKSRYGNWITKPGESFRLALTRGFNSDEDVTTLFDKLEKGAVKLEELSDHYREVNDKYFMGLTNVYQVAQ